MVTFDRALRTTVAAVSAVTLMGCTATVAGVAQKATVRAGADDVIVALLDTGNYATATGHAMGPAGSADGGALLEAHRMAVNVVGPWQVDATYRQRGSLLNTTTTAPLNEAKLLSQNNVLADPMPDVATAHGFITGFSSLRMTGPTKLLINAVLRFPDVDSAGAAAREMADKYPHDDLRPRPAAIDRHPEAVATLYDASDGSIASASFTAHGPYVLFEATQIDDRTDAAAASVLIGLTLDQQEPLIDRFTPTDPAKLPDLPKDPTGQLLARTLWAPDNSAPFMVGVWDASAWLHFEDDPVEAAALFSSARVEAVAQRLTTVYQSHDPAGAAQLVEQFARDMRGTENVHPTAGVTGFPGAQCFARAGGHAGANDAMSWQRVYWAFKCVGRADRYAFTAFSNDEKDAKQQIAAQYRILAGR